MQGVDGNRSGTHFVCSSSAVAKELSRQIVFRSQVGLVFKAHRLVYHSTLGWRVIKKKKRVGGVGGAIGSVVTHQFLLLVLQVGEQHIQLPHLLIRANGVAGARASDGQ